MRASAVIAVVLSIAVAGWMLSGQFGGGEARTPRPEADSAEPARAPQRVRVKRMSAQSHRVAITVRGRTEAGRRVEIRAETDGRIVEIAASRGDAVRQGSVLARLAVEGREAKIAEYKARLQQRRIHYDAMAALAKKGLSSKEALATAKADIDAATAAVEQVEVEIARTRLRAPFDGLLLEGHAELGDYLKQGDRFARIIDLDPILFVGSVTEQSVARLRRGLPAVARSLGGPEIRGTLRYIAPSADPAARTYRIEVEAENPDHRIREGLTADITIEVDTMMAHFVTPALLTLADDGAIGIKTVDERNRVRFRPVDIIEDTPDGIWLGGLPPLITVITVGQGFVVAGQEVEPVTPAGDGASPAGPGSGDGPGSEMPAAAYPAPATPAAATPGADSAARSSAAPRSAS